MDEGSTREPSGDEALRELAIAASLTAMQLGYAVCLRDTRRLTRTVWLLRAIVLMNVTLFAYNAATANDHWLRWLCAPINLGGAFYAFRAAEVWGRERVKLKAGLATVREQIKSIERLLHESRT